jgi:hypothetical protein
MLVRGHPLTHPGLRRGAEDRLDPGGRVVKDVNVQALRGEEDGVAPLAGTQFQQPMGADALQVGDGLSSG